MGSISSTNPGLTNLLQTLSSADPSLLSLPSTTSAVESASPSDIVQLSQAALQLESVDAMFGTPGASPADPMIQALDAMLGVPDTSSTSDPATQALGAILGVPSSSSTNQNAVGLQASGEALLGLTGSVTGSLLDVTG